MRPRPSFQLTGLLLYLLTVLFEVPVILLRVFLVFVFVEGPLLIIGKPLSVLLWLLIALVPTLWSMLALITPAGSGWWWRQHAGGREPSQRERLAYEDAIEHLQAHSSEPLLLPGSWFVVDEQQPDAGVCGDALMLSRGLLEVDLPAVLPHELGHVGSFDGRLTAALNRLVIHQAPRPPKDPAEAEEVQSGEGAAVVEGLLGLFDVSPKTIEIITGVFIFTWFARKFLAFARGGLGLWITGPLWGLYWRGREYAADQYAAELGQADEVADFLETHALIYDHPMPFVWLTEHSHPPTELRIDRLRNHTPEPAVDLAQPAAAQLRASPR